MKIWNNPKSRFLLPAIGGFALLGIGGAALAVPDAGPRDGKRGGLCAKVECTDAQREDVKAVMSELRADSKGDRAAVKRLHKQLAAEFAKAQPDEGAMRSIQAQIATHQQQMSDRGMDAMLEIHALLDAEQRATLAKAMERRGMRGVMRNGKGHRKGKGQRGDRKREAAG
ncbi:MAG: Spy/CpxP family protein refolding chaperone [Myxococcota bacterium]